MALGDKETTLILKAVDQSSQPVLQVLENVKKLVAQQKELNEASKKGAADRNDFNKSIADLEKLLRALGQQKATLEEVNRLRDTWLDKQIAIDELAQRADNIKYVPEESRTKDQIKDLTRLERQINSMQPKVDAAKSAWDNLQKSVSAMGVTSQNFAETQKLLASAMDDVASHYKQANQLSLEFIANKKLAAEATKAEADAQRKAAAELVAAERAEEQADKEFTARRKAERTEEARSLAEANRAMAAANAVKGTRAGREEDIRAAFANAEAEKKAREEAASSQDKSDKEFAARNRAAREEEARRVAAAEADITRLAETQRRARREEVAEAFAAADKEVAARKDALEAEDRYNKEFANRRRAERAAEVQRLADIEKSMAAANAVKSTRGGREEDIRAAFANADAEKKAREEAAAAEDKDNAEFVARNRQARQAEADRVAAAQADIERLASTQTRARREEIAGAFAARDAEIEAQKAAEKAASDRYKSEQKQRAADLDQQQALFDFENMLAAQQKKAFDERMAREQALAAQRDAAFKAQMRLPVTQALGVSGTGPQNNSPTSDALAALVSPAEAARKTLAGVEAEVTSLSSLMEGGHKRTEEYKQALRTLYLSLNELSKQASLADAFKRQEEATRIAEAGMRRHTAAMTAMQQQGRSAGVVLDGFDEKLRKTEQAARRSAEAYNIENERLAQLRAGLDRAGIGYVNIDAAITRILSTAGEVGKLLPQLEKGAGRGGEIGLFGLRPYELQNLSYQVNDVFTQLASGTSITQTFSQQFGQIFQLFQVQLLNFAKSMKEIPGLLPGVGLAIAGLTVYVLALARAMDEVALRRGFAAQIAMGVDSAGVNTQTLVDAAKAAEKLGIDLKEAGKGAAELARSAIAMDKIGGLVEMAAKLSKATMRPFADTVKDVQTAFTGGYEEMRKFLVEYNMLDADTDKRIHDLYRENEAEKARGIASEVASRQAAKGYAEFTGPAEKATLALREAWHDFLASFGDEKTVAHWTNFWAGALNVITIVDAFFTKNRFNGTERIETAPGSTGKTTSDAGPEFAALRDKIADLVGINREAFARLQKSEGQLGPDGKWLDAHDPDGKVIPDGGKGAIQLVRSTFDELKAKFPDLIKGDIHDVTSNLMAGALYFRQMMEKTGGNVERGALAYKAGPGALANPGIARPGYAESARQVGEGMGSGLVTPKLDTDAVRKGLEGTATATTEVGKATEAAKIATTNWTEAEDKRTRSMAQNALTEIQRQKNLSDAIKDSNEEVIKSARKAEQEGRASAISQEEIKRVQLERQKILEDNYKVASLARDLEVTSQYEAMRQKELEADKTNLTARLAANVEKYDKLSKEVEKFNAEERYPTKSGLTVEQARQTVSQAREDDRQRIILDAANEIVKKAQEERDAALKINAERLANAKPNEIAALNAEQARIITKGTNAVLEAVKKADAALDQGNLPQTPALQAQRERNRLAAQTAGGGQSARAFTDQAISLATQSVTDVGKERTDNIDALISGIKSGSIKFSDALRTGTELIRTMAPRLNSTVEEANKALLATLPGATPRKQAEINAGIAANKLLQTKANEDLERLIVEGLKDDQEKVTAIVKQRDEQQAAIFKRQRDGIITYADMMKELADLSAKYNPRIKQATDQVIKNTRDALTVPGLREGFRSQLEQQGTHAATQGDTNLAGAEESRQKIAAGLAQLNTLREYLRDTEREQTALQKTNDATIISSEPKRAEAYKKTAEEAAKIIPALRTQIDLAEQLGQITPAAAAKSRAALAEFGAETKYVSKFQEELSQTIQSSIGNHAMQAIDMVGQALGNLAAGTGTLKDVWASAGQAFAQFTAGVLKDIATMIIKFYILAGVKTMLNIESGGGSGLMDAIFGGASKAAVKHSGGMVGDSNGASRVVDLSLFRNARRMHAGGIAGLSSDEIPTILQKGERVLTAAQQQAAANATAGGAGGGTSVRNVLAVGDREIAGAMNGAHGEKVILNVLQRNAPTVKKWVG